MKFVCEDIKETDEIKIYSEESLLPENENINIIETGEKIIVKVKREEEESLTLVDCFILYFIFWMIISMIGAIAIVHWYS